MKENEIEQQGAVTQHRKEISVNEKAIDVSPKSSDTCPEPISELSNRYLNEGN